MCGIVGFSWKDDALVRRMSDITSHRGPDDSGMYTDENISLGQRRLSIIDLSEKGHQPMCNENKDVWIIFNGEIYNFMDLREDLEKKGHRFMSDSDTETIIHAYEEYGPRCLDKLNGMFAFAIYDARQQGKKLFLARDRLGIKPMHYTFVSRDGNDKGKKDIIFGSEIKSLLLDEGVKREVNLNGLHKFINFNYIFGEETLFKGVYKLGPASYMLYDLRTKKYSIKHYWDLKADKTDYNEKYYLDRIREGLSESIKLQLVSDVPLGVFLSGGIDSSSIVALMSGFKEVKKPIQTFAVGFNEPWDELKDAKRVSEEFNTDHHEIYVESDVLDHTPEFIWHMDTPKTNISPQYYISKLAKKDVTVALTGLGGDELFAGYRRHKYYYHQKTFSTLIPKSVANPLFGMMSKVAVSNLLKRGMLYLANIHDREKTYSIAVPLLVYDDERDELYGDVMKKAERKSADKGGVQSFKQMLKPYFMDKKMNYYNQAMKMETQTYLNDDLLERMDRMSMAHAVETRVPFLDHNFVEFAFSIPDRFRRFKLGSKSGKDLLCKAMKGKVPDFVFSKKKVGFNMSPYYWYKSHLKDHIQSVLTKQGVEKRGYFNYSYVKKIIGRKPNPNLYYQYQTLWNMMAFEVWHKLYIDSDIKSIEKPKMTMKYYETGR